MIDCNICREYLSARLDGELTAEEERGLNEHLEACTECRNFSRLLSEIDHASHENIISPPPELKERVMEGIKKPAAAKNKNHRWLTRYVAIAACAVLVILVTPRAPQLGCSQAGSNTASSFLGETEAPQAPETESKPNLAVRDEPSPDKAPTEAEDGIGMVNPSAVSEFDLLAKEYTDDYYMLIELHEELPEEFAEIERRELEGATLIVITNEQAARLAREGYKRVFGNENAETSAVLFFD